MIELRHVTKTYDAEVRALDDVSLSVAAGELVLLTGPSGAGKTTLLRLVYAGERPDAGKVLVAGRDVARLTRASIPYLRRNLGVVFQDFKLLPERTALENASIALEVRGLRPPEVRARALRALADVSLVHRASVRAARLSAGEQQRVAIARALAARPAVLLCDEPTGNLDPELTREILDLLLAESRRGTTILLATHDPQVMAFAGAHGCRRVRLVAGRVEPGEPEGLLDLQSPGEADAIPEPLFAESSDESAADLVREITGERSLRVASQAGAPGEETAIDEDPYVTVDVSIDCSIHDQVTERLPGAAGAGALEEVA